MEKCIIVAVADNMAIGRGNAIPWHISADLKYFKSTTVGSPVIMGRRTFESLGCRPLPGRRNIVVSRSLRPMEGIRTAGSLEEALNLAGDCPKCFVMGGASVYAEAMSVVDKLYVTRVHAVIEDADAFFPDIDGSVWKLDSRSESFTDAGINYEFEVYSRI